MDLPEASLEYWRDGRELSLEIAVGISGCDTVLDRLPLVKPHRSHRDLRSTSTPVQSTTYHHMFQESRTGSSKRRTRYFFLPFDVSDFRLDMESRDSVEAPFLA